MSFFPKLEARAKAVDSLLCVGLDPHLEDLARPDGASAEAFCRALVEETAPYAAAFKPNSAFFEALGSEGWRALGRVIAAVPEEIPVILDAKRGDIASTAMAYARACFEDLGADAVTVHPYLGRDAVAPFVEDATRGVFVLCRTSNPGSNELQSLRVGDRALFEVVAQRARTWSRHDNVGLVVGATQPEALSAVRAIWPGVWLLAPGLGAQGAVASVAVRAGLRGDGLGVLFPVSRDVSRAPEPGKRAEALRDLLRAEARSCECAAPPAMDALRRSIARGLVEAECVRFGQFTLKSGQVSPIYVDLRRLAGFPVLLEQVAAAMDEVLCTLELDHVAALPYAALPIGTAIALRRRCSLIYPRHETKGYGTRASVEGVFAPGDRAVVVDDLATTGSSKFEALERLAEQGLRTLDIVVLIDREGGAGAALAAAGYRLHAVFRLGELLDFWEADGTVASHHLAAVRGFLSGDGAT